MLPFSDLNRSVTRPLLLAAALAAAAVPGASAQPMRLPPASAPCLPGDGCPTLTLDETLDRVAAYDPRARSADLERDAAAADVLAARGGFDPLLSTGVTYKTEDEASKLGLWQTRLSVPIDAPFSPSFDLNHRLGVGKSINPADETDDFGETRLGFSFSPLGGRGTDRRRTALAQARLFPQTADAAVAFGRNKLLLDAAKDYWRWAEAWAAVEVRDDLLGVARARADFVARRVRAGEVPPVDSIEARLTVASREGDRISALRAAESAAVTVATYLWTPDGEPAALRSAPAPLPPLPPLPAEDDRVILADALDRRPEIARARLRAEAARLDERLARQQFLPDLRVGVQAISYGEQPAGFDDVYVGFSVAQPLGFRPARAAIAEARVDVSRRDFDRDVAARQVTADVENALVVLRRADERVRLAQEQAALAETLRRAEVRRFELGDGTLFLINQREQALAEARLREIGARADYLQAVATYRWATGTLGE